MKKPPIGFIGMGIMGVPMVHHLANADYELTVYDINRPAAEKAAAGFEGITVVESLAQVAERSEVVVTMLPNGKVVREVALGEGGLAQGFKKGSLLLDTSSSEPWITTDTANSQDTG